MRLTRNIFVVDFFTEIVIILVFAAVVGTVELFTSPTGILHWGSQAIIRIDDGTYVYAEIADDPEERRVGLSEHVSLDPDRGMLFLFDEPSRPAFWMKDMDFPIDIVWLSGGTIVGIESDVQPSDQTIPPSVRPMADIDQVLEVNAGFAAKHGLKTGQTLDIKLP